MNESRHTNRRTVLKTITASVLGSGIATGTANAAPGNAHGRRNEIEITAQHDHDTGEHSFDLSTSETASGWTTLRFDSYFHVNLKPGDYAWIAEVPDPESQGLLTEFSVPSGRATKGR